MKTLLWLSLVLLLPVASFGQTPAKFDSYLLTLSWSPEYCHGHSGNVQCASGKHFGFVVHGLWPEYKTGGGPENCGNQPGLADPSKMLDIMPDPQLIAHEWTTHGTCTGLSADAYFALIRQAYNSIKIPGKFTAAKTQTTETPAQIKKDFEASNSSLSDNKIMINCASNYLQAVEICMTKTLTPTACTAPKDCQAKTVKIPPVQ